MHVVEILLSHGLLMLHLVLLVSISICWVLTKILVIYIRLIWNKVLMILLLSDIIDDLRSLRILKNLLFVELIVNLAKILHIREFSRFLHMLTPLPFWLWILDLEVVVILVEVFLVIDGAVIILSSF